VISLGGIVLSRSLRVGGYELDEAIARYLRLEHSLAIGSKTAESIKIGIGSAVPSANEDVTEVRGRHLITGLPTEIVLNAAEVRAAIELPLREIVQTIKDTLEETPPELTGDIARDGILLAGGGTLLSGLDELLVKETGLPVISAESPLTCVVTGSGEALDHFDELGPSSGRRREASRG
jgi:rod shape-determining protein MreB